MKTTFIYALCEPETKEIRYIGKTNDLTRRFKEHISISKQAKNHLGYWLAKIIAGGKVPELIELREVVGNGSDAERRYIRLALECQMRLVNSTRGGDGAGQGEDNHFFGKQHTSKSKALIGAKTKERKVEMSLMYTPEKRKALSEENTGDKNHFFGEKHSEETRAIMRLAWTPERHAKMSIRFSGENNPMFGRKRTKESLRKLKETLARKKALKEVV